MRRMNNHHTPILSALLAIAMLAPSLPAQEAPTGSPGKIAEVTVFEDRARVDRALEVTLASGLNTVTVTQLPLSLDENSVWAELASDASGASLGRVLGVRLETTVHIDDIRSEVEQLRDRYRALEVELTERAARRNVEEKKRALAKEYEEMVRLAMLEGSMRDDAAEAAGILIAEEWAAEQVLAASEAIDALDRESRELLEEKQAIERDLGRLGAGAARTTLTASVQIEASRAGSTTLRLGYDVDDAWWTPVYEARLDETTGEVELTYAAEIEQQTGEDWVEAQLLLSTQRSSLGMAPPVLIPIEIDGYEVDRRGASLVSSEARGSIQAGTTLADDEDGMAWGLDEAEIEDSGTIARFRVPVRATIPTDGRQHRVPILEKELAADLAFECVPRLAPHTYRRGKLVNETGAPLLPGMVRVFRDGAFVGQTELESIAPGAEFTLGFGVEGRITVRTVERVDRERVVGSFSKGQRRTLADEFFIESRMPTATRLILVDRIPVSEIEGVEVELTKECAPKPAVDRDGICRWPLDLAPGAERSVMFEYRVTVDSGVNFPVEAVE